jgi:hypothetical protein
MCSGQMGTEGRILWMISAGKLGQRTWSSVICSFRAKTGSEIRSELLAVILTLRLELLMV